MPNFAIVENGKVTNIVVAELDYAAEKGWIAMPSGVEIDWDYIDGQFVNNRPIITPRFHGSKTNKRIQSPFGFFWGVEIESP